MQYKYNNKNYNIPDNEIDRLQSQLDVTLAEACEIYLSDHDLVTNKTVETLSAKATKNRITSTIHGAKQDKRERKPREKKENPLKKEIVKALFSGILNDIKADGEVIITNDEKYIDFTVGGREFTVNLVEHRKKK